MQPIVQFSLGVAIGVLLMQCYNGRLPAATEERSRSGKIVDAARDQLSRDDVSGGISSSGIEDFLNDPDVKRTLSLDKVTDGVFLISGYSFVNVIILEGQEGLILVDAMESVESARAVLNKLREVTTKPIEAIVLSHHHFDHIGGLSVFIEDVSNPPDIWSYHTLPDIIKSNFAFGPRGRYGATHQFGLQLNHDRLWPKLPHSMNGLACIIPNRLIYDEIYNAQIAGLNITFIHVPGEADDELAIWLPDKRVLLPGDDVYKSFPNIYAVRGTSPRDILVWAKSIGQMRDLGAEYFVPAHGPSVVGSQKIFEILTAYASAMWYVHDQTVRRLNEHRHIDELGKLIRLPTALSNHPYLRETYGTVEWTAKAVYQKYVGWFSGDPAELFPLTPTERSQKFVNWIGVDRIMEEVESALESGHSQWALELASHVHRAIPDNLRAKWLRLQALRRRAGEQLNPSARNYYLTSALDSYGFINWNFDPTSVLKNAGVGVVMGLMKYRLKAELTDGINETLVLNFTDTNTIYRLQIVYSVLEISVFSEADAYEKLPTGALKITTTEQVWLDILLGKTQAAAAYMGGQLTIDGSLMDTRKFMSYF